MPSLRLYIRMILPSCFQRVCNNITYTFFPFQYIVIILRTRDQKDSQLQYMLSPILQSIQLLGHFSDQELSLVQDKLVFRSIKKNSFIVQEGKICQAFYFLTKGSCIHTFTTPEGVDIILNLYVQNDWLADYQSFVSQKPSKNNIQAFEDCELAELTAQSFHELIGLSPSFFKIGRLFEKLQNPETLWNIKSHDEIYKELLATRPQLIQKFPLKYIASYLRIAPETLSRIRKRIK